MSYYRPSPLATKIMATACANPEWTPREVATSVGCTLEYVHQVLRLRPKKKTGGQAGTVRAMLEEYGNDDAFEPTCYDDPTDAPPGSEGKIDRLTARVAMGSELWIDGDQETWDGPPTREKSRRNELLGLPAPTYDRSKSTSRG